MDWPDLLAPPLSLLLPEFGLSYGLSTREDQLRQKARSYVDRIIRAPACRPCGSISRPSTNGGSISKNCQGDRPHHPRELLLRADEAHGPPAELGVEGKNRQRRL